METATDAPFANRRFEGKGHQHPNPLPGALSEAEPYFVPEDLKRAVNMAITLRRPLLLEGEPGTGKTRLAYAVAYELGYPLKAIYIRSTSQAKDLLYTYDAVRRLYDIQEQSAAAQVRQLAALSDSRTRQNVHQTEGDQAPNEADRTQKNEKYVTLGELGEAIELSMQDIPSVVLIDEIDKADLDFPNDLLLVLDRLQFTIDELQRKKYDALQGNSRAARRSWLPLVFITSNREKELPAPFLRRCLFYYIPFPSEDEMRAIVNKHFVKEITPLFEQALLRFWELRKRTWRKAPTTSELLDWLTLLESDTTITAENIKNIPLSRLPYIAALLKMQDDLERLKGNA